MDNNAKVQWVKWLETYGAANFYEAFMRTAQDAESECTQCGEKVYLDIEEGGGVPDWRTESGDYGCINSPEGDDDGTGGHNPRKSRDGIGS